MGERADVAGVKGAAGFLCIEPQMWPQGVEG